MTEEELAGLERTYRAAPWQLKDIQRLIAEIRRLRAELETWQKAASDAVATAVNTANDANTVMESRLAEERERCAKVVEDCGAWAKTLDWHRQERLQAPTQRELAAAIRALK